VAPSTIAVIVFCTFGLMDWACGEEDTLTFPDSFSSADRCRLHIICEQLKLNHKSPGEGDERRQTR
jgi:hypothetical protein